MLQVIKSQRNEDQIIHEGYIYEIKRISREKIVWRCIKRDCKGSLYTSLSYLEPGAIFNLKFNHTHEVDLIDVDVKLKIQKMKELVLNTKESLRSIINRVLRGAGSETIRKIGNFDHISRNLRNYRNLILNPKPYAYEALSMSSVLSHTHTNEEFYRYGPGNFRNMRIFNDFLIFFSDTAMQNLSSQNVWSIDGTFKVVPKPFFQLFTISYILNDHVFPSIFRLLKNKKKETYLNLIYILKTFNPDLSPIIIKTDFEYASIAAFNESFNNVRISGCLFHLSQAVLRKVKELGLFVQYKSNAVIKKYVKCLITLAFVRLDFVENTFTEIIGSFSFPNILRPVYEYFYFSYINEGDNTKYPFKLWNIRSSFSDNFPRTNNAIEGWHNVFNSTFNSTKYSLITLISNLKDEEDAIRMKRIRLDLGHNLEKKRKYIQNEILLRNFLENNERDYGLEFVLNLSSIIFY